MFRLNNLPSSDEDSPPSSPPPLKRPRLSPPETSVPQSLATNYRIYSWNCDDIAPYLPLPKVQNRISSYFGRVSPPLTAKNSKQSQWFIRNILKNREWPEFLCLQEVKIAITDKARINQAREAAQLTEDNDHGPEYEMYMNFPVVAKRPTQNRRMYGVITYVRADIAKTIEKTRGVDWDDEGRVLILEMPRFALINLYAVNGTDSPYVVRSTGKTTGLTRHERKRIFNNHLKDECLQLIRKGFEVCIVGDINISRARIDSVPRLRSAIPHVLARKEFNESFLPETRLIDAWRERHGEDARGYTWYFRSAREGTDCARVDMILCSKSLYQRTAEVEIEKWGGPMCGSDHTLMWIKIDGFNRTEGYKRTPVKKE